jgi:hypothetical protein
MRGAAFSFAVPVSPVATGAGTPSFSIPLTRLAVHLFLHSAENEQLPADLEPAVHPDK